MPTEPKTSDTQVIENLRRYDLKDLIIMLTLDMMKLSERIARQSEREYLTPEVKKHLTRIVKRATREAIADWEIETMRRFARQPDVKGDTPAPKVTVLPEAPVKSG